MLNGGEGGGGGSTNQSERKVVVLIRFPRLNNLCALETSWHVCTAVLEP